MAETQRTECWIVLQVLEPSYSGDEWDKYITAVTWTREEAKAAALDSYRRRNCDRDGRGFAETADNSLWRFGDDARTVSTWDDRSPYHATAYRPRSPHDVKYGVERVPEYEIERHAIPGPPPAAADHTRCIAVVSCLEHRDGVDEDECCRQFLSVEVCPGQPKGAG